MHLGEIISRVQSQADFAPINTPGFQKYLTDTINDAYQDLWYSRTWTFNTKTVDLPVYPDLLAADAGQLFATEQAVPGAPLQTTIGATYFEITYAEATVKFYTQTDGRFVEQLHGAYLYVDGRDYRIVDTQITDNGATWTLRFYVDEPFKGDYLIGTTVEFTDWTIKFRTYKLPEDCTEIMDVSWSNLRDVGGLRSGQAFSLPARNANDLAVNWNLTAAKPYAYIAGASTFMWDTYESFSLTETTGSGGTYFPPDTTYFGWEDVDIATGAPSGVVNTITWTPSANNVESITFTDDRHIHVGTYRRLLLGVKRAINDPIKWIIFQNNPVTTLAQQYSSTNVWRYPETSITLTAGNYLAFIGLTSGQSGYRDNRMMNYIGGGSRKNITFYPRLSTKDIDAKFLDSKVWTTFYEASVASVRYLYKCSPLSDKFDSPQLPPEYHNLLVFKALESVALKFDKAGTASYYARKYDEMLKKMMIRYASERNTIATKSNSMGVSRGFWWRTGTITYNP